MRLLLDTNALIALAAPDHPLFHAIERSLEKGGEASTSVVAWHEYVRGPISEEDRRCALSIIQERIHSLNRGDAELAATLFNETGRRRTSTADCLIAACAIRHGARMVTRNLDDFRCFEPWGLQFLGSAQK